jgi:hypothetical protein
MFRKVLISQRLPPPNKYVVTIDEAGNQFIYCIFESNVFPEGWGWTSRDVRGINTPNDNLRMIYWLEEFSPLEEFYDNNV